MVWIDLEAFWFSFPALDDVLEGRETPKHLQPSGVVVGADEGLEVFAELVVTVVMVAPDRRLLDGPVHALDLPVGPGMVRLRKPVLDPVLGVARRTQTLSNRCPMYRAVGPSR